MKHILVAAFITLLALGMGCAWISPAAETASEGIQVHGHWTVTVSNPDGSVDAVHEFENDFTNSGTLTNILNSHTNVDAWAIGLSTEGDQLQFRCLNGIGHFKYSALQFVPAEMTIQNLPGLPFYLTGSCSVVDTGEDLKSKIFAVSTYTIDLDTCTKIHNPTEAESGDLKNFCVSTFIDNPDNPFDIFNEVTGALSFTGKNLMQDAIEVYENQTIGFRINISFN